LQLDNLIKVGREEEGGVLGGAKETIFVRGVAPGGKGC